MAHLIDKDALVAEIKKLISNGKFKCQQSQENNDQENYIAWSEHIATCEKILSFTYTLEVKEVDLEKELESWRHNHFHGRRDKDASGEYLERSSQLDIAKHFFELGLNAQHSSIDIPNIDDIFEEEGIDPNSKDAKIFKECYYMALEKLKEQKGEGV